LRKSKDLRRHFLKILVWGSVLFAWGGFNDLHAAIPNEKPNVVLIFTDDQGTIDVNCYGSKDLHTPNLDKLARRGVRFTQFYVGAPVCSPSRAALLTGRYPQRAGLTSNSGGNRGLLPQQFTIAEMLRENGYRTALFGKWHLGEAPELSPLSQGFDQFFGHKKGCIDNYSHFFYWSGPNVHDLWKNNSVHWEDGKYFPDMVVREAVRFLEENKNRPFFLFLPFNIPHYPLQGQEKYRQMVSHLPEPRKSYAALVSTLDEKIGKVIDKIDQLGLREKTIIIFLSDHGHSVEVRTNSGGGSAGPYRGHKFTLWEGGIRVPCIISWPGEIPQNQVRDQIAISTDWLPTIANYCHVKLPDHKIDGKNIASVIASGNTVSPHFVLHWEHSKQWAVRKDQWKLVVNGPDSMHHGNKIPQEKIFLSDLEKNPGESNNLASQNPDIVKRLTLLHKKWTTEVVQQ